MLKFVKCKTAVFFSATDTCRSAGKKCTDFLTSRKARSEVRRLSEILQVQADSLVIKGPTDTLVHPGLRLTLEKWCLQHAGTSGLVYAVTSDFTDLVKIGRWRGTPDRLASRFRTYYGRDLQLYTAQVADCLAAEDVLHRRFSSSRVWGELYRKEHMAAYTAALLEL